MLTSVYVYIYMHLLKALLRRNWVAMYAAASTYVIHFKIEMKGLQLQLWLIVILSVNDMVSFQTQTPGAIQKES